MTEIIGLRGLRRHDAASTDLSVAMLRLLRAHSGEVEISVCDALPTETPVFQCADGVEFCITTAQGLCHPAIDSDIEAACDALDTADHLLSHAELALSISLDPIDLKKPAEVGESAMQKAVLAINDGVHIVYLAADRDHPQAESWINAAHKITPNPHDLALIAQLLLSGPKLPIAAASDIGNCDMVLIGQRMLAHMHVNGIAPIAGLFDMRDGTFVIGDALQDIDIEGNYVVDDSENTPDQSDAASRFGALQVPVTIRLPEQVVSAADIANLQSGATLILGPVVQGLIAELVVGGKALAHGEIVQVGTNFALLVDDRTALPSRTAHSPNTHANADIIDMDEE